MARFRRKPVETPDEIDAIHFDGTHAAVLAVMKFVDAGRGTTVINIRADSDPAKTHITIPTRDGNKRIEAGDWLVRRTDGGLDCYDDALFTSLYEAAPLQPSRPW